jgi:hypothetical protein
VPNQTYPTIQAAVNRATCATINVAAGIYTELITIAHNVTIRGEGPDSTIVDGGGRGPVVTIASGTVMIIGVTIQNGLFSPPPPSFSNGGGLVNSGTLPIQNSTVADNGALFGAGAIYNAEGTVTIENSTVADNGVTHGAGAIYNGVAFGSSDINSEGIVSVENSTFVGNISGYDVGAIANVGTLTVENSTFADNTGGSVGAIATGPATRSRLRTASCVAMRRVAVVASTMAPAAPA